MYSNRKWQPKVYASEQDVSAPGFNRAANGRESYVRCSSQSRRLVRTTPRQKKGGIRISGVGPA
jgi:hypothetical protein